MRPNPAATVDEYMAQIESDVARETLSKLRAIIKDELPEAKEVISYQIPTYKLNRTMVCFAAFKKHCSFFPGSIVSEFEDQLKDYKTSKGTIQFPNDQLLPEPLIRAILKARFRS